LREAITALAAINARHAAGQVRSPGGLLRKMVELHQTGGLRLDRTLFGLAERMDGGRRRDAGVSSGRGGSGLNFTVLMDRQSTV